MSREEISALIDKARRSLRSARNLLEDGDGDFAISRAYYAMLYAATASLLARGVRRSKHSAVIGAFGETFVKSGQLDPRHHQTLHAGFQDRSEADYGRLVPSRQAVEAALGQAQEFGPALEEGKEIYAAAS